ncbi:MAG TPA: phosphosulfolactate synthase, partial [Candidatus Marinimicrobia bacterium]|nr:phosphosulfolactate synthase [Candidatus Neomarinimicrobiota bacterium]
QIMGNDVENLIWEAPLKTQQTFLINRFGNNVSLR